MAPVRMFNFKQTHNLSNYIKAKTMGDNLIVVEIIIAGFCKLVSGIKETPILNLLY